MFFRSGAVLLSIGALAGISHASGGPVPVSPGNREGTRIRDSCPTFSWGTAEGAEGYELVVFRLEEGREPAEVLRHTVEGAANGWTPPLGRCLDRGGEYAWSVRALGAENAETGGSDPGGSEPGGSDPGGGAEGPTEWSEPSLFEVVAAPGPLELDEALRVVGDYLEARRGSTEERSAPTPLQARAPDDHPVRRSSGTMAPAPTKLTVDGNVDATTYTGDGSNLAGVADIGDLCDLYSAAALQPAGSLCDVGCQADGYEPNEAIVSPVDLGDFTDVDADELLVFANLYPEGDVDWYRFDAIDHAEGDTELDSYFVTIELVSNPVSQFRLVVYQGCQDVGCLVCSASSSFVTRTTGNLPSCNGLPTSYLVPSFNDLDDQDDTGSFWVQVERDPGALNGCDTYSLRISNGA